MTVVKTARLCEELNISPRRIQQLVREGMPRISHGKYDLEICKEWRSERTEDIESGVVAHHNVVQERARYYAAQADSAEFNLETKRAEHVHQETALTVFSNVCTELVLALDTWVDRAPSAEEMKQRRECAWSCREHLARTVEELCSNTAGVSEHRATGLRHRRQVR